MIFIKLHQINKSQDSGYYLTEVRLNVAHVVFISENLAMKKSLSEGKMNIGINKTASFSDILVSSKASGNYKITVVGTPDSIESKINKSSKMILRG